jgi:hypothetical protein
MWVEALSAVCPFPSFLTKHVRRFLTANNTSPKPDKTAVETGRAPLSVEAHPGRAVV